MASLDQFFVAFSDELKTKLGPSYNWNLYPENEKARISIFKQVSPDSGMQTYIALLSIEDTKLTITRAGVGVDHVIALNDPSLFDILLEQLSTVERLNDARGSKSYKP